MGDTCLPYATTAYVKKYYYTKIKILSFIAQIVQKVSFKKKAESERVYLLGNSSVFLSLLPLLRLPPKSCSLGSLIFSAFTKANQHQSSCMLFYSFLMHG